MRMVIGNARVREAIRRVSNPWFLRRLLRVLVRFNPRRRIPRSRLLRTDIAALVEQEARAAPVTDLHLAEPTPPPPPSPGPPTDAYLSAQGSPPPLLQKLRAFAGRWFGKGAAQPTPPNPEPEEEGWEPSPERIKILTPEDEKRLRLRLFGPKPRTWKQRMESKARRFTRDINRAFEQHYDKPLPCGYRCIAAYPRANLMFLPFIGERLSVLYKDIYRDRLSNLHNIDQRITFVTPRTYDVDATRWDDVTFRAEYDERTNSIEYGFCKKTFELATNDWVDRHLKWHVHECPYAYCSVGHRRLLRRLMCLGLMLIDYLVYRYCLVIARRYQRQRRQWLGWTSSAPPVKRGVPGIHIT